MQRALLLHLTCAARCRCTVSQSLRYWTRSHRMPTIYFRFWKKIPSSSVLHPMKMTWEQQLQQTPREQRLRPSHCTFLILCQEKCDSSKMYRTAHLREEYYKLHFEHLHRSLLSPEMLLIPRSRN